MKVFLILITVLSLSVLAYGEEITITFNLVSADGVGKEIGTIQAMDTKYGLVLKPMLSDLPPGMHGFHLHENPSCAPAKKEEKMTAAQSAGGHLDPAKVGKHEGPFADGHMGDLQALSVGTDGKATYAVTAPRLKTSDLKGHALVIHAGGDNYADQPDPLGGGGARIACGVVK